MVLHCLCNKFQNPQPDSVSTFLAFPKTANTTCPLTGSAALLLNLFLVNANPAVCYYHAPPWNALPTPVPSILYRPASPGHYQPPESLLGYQPPALIYPIHLELSTTYTPPHDIVPMIVLDSFFGGGGRGKACA